MNDKILSIEQQDIICFFEVENKQYCAIANNEIAADNTVYFGLVTELEDNSKIITSVSDKVIDKVIAEYVKYVEFFESEDELDIKEGKE